MLKRMISAVSQRPTAKSPEECHCEETAKAQDRAEVERTVTLQESRLRELLNRVDQDIAASVSTFSHPHPKP